MISVDKAIIARVQKSGKRFEILVDPELAYKAKAGESVEIRDLLAVPEIFRDARKGEVAAREDLQACFGTTDVETIAKEIIRHGEVQLTTEFRRKKLEEMKRQIAEFISKNAVDARTNATLPIQRILNAMEQAKVHIDIFKSVDEQINEVIRKLSELLPLKFERVKLEVRVPPAHAARCYGLLKSFNASLNYASDGSLIAKLELPAGMKAEFYEKLNALSRGEAVIQEKGEEK